MNRRTLRLNAAVCVGTLLVVGCGQRSAPAPAAQRHPHGHPSEDIQSVRIHFEGFTKSKSGATWMAWPNKVKEALVGLKAVRSVDMEIERDEFLVTFDAEAASVDKLLDVSQRLGFEGTIVSAEAKSEKPEGATFFQEALAKARREQKPFVVDFTASWCEPCQRMLRETFPNAKVAALLEQCVFLKVDTDHHPQLAQRFGVVGLPDIRFLSPAGNEARKFLDFQGPDAFAVALQDLLRVTAAPPDDRKLIVLSEGEQNIKDLFNRDTGRVRLLLILSPTWGPCQSGARVVQDILDEIDNDDLRVYVVWSPVLREDSRMAAGQAVAHISDGRAVHLWDEDKSLGLSFGKLVTLPRKRDLAWDVYFLFDDKSEWTESPPKPAEWMHQLGMDERLLDGDKLRSSVEKLLMHTNPWRMLFTAWRLRRFCEPLELEQLLSASGILRVLNHALLNDLLFYYEDSIQQIEPRTEIMMHPSGLKDVPTLAENITVAAKALFGLGFTMGSLINGMQANRLATDDPNRTYLTTWAVAMMICAVYLFERAVSGGKS